MEKKLIRLTESDLKRIISESVKKILKEEERKTWRGVPGAYLTPDGNIEYRGDIIDVDDLEDELYEWFIDEYEEMMDRPWLDSTDMYDEVDTEWLANALDEYHFQNYR